VNTDSEISADIGEKERQRRAKVSAALKKRYAEDPTYRARVAENTRRQHREGRINPGEMTEERRRKISEAQKGRPRAYMTEDHCRMMAKRNWEKNGNKPGFLDPLRAAQDIALARSQAEMQTNPKRGKFAANIHARWWHVRDPRGVAHHFRNLRHFIRNNPHLFHPDDLRMGHLSDPNRTRIEGGFSSISPRIKKPCCSWKGWTWIAGYNEDDEDPLDRKMHAGQCVQEVSTAG
jgi:hypothetical protein